jgi:hypothetical protein
MVLEVTGPMLAVLRAEGQERLRARKFSTVEELVKVIRSAPSERKRSRPPVMSVVSGTVR